MRSFQQLSYYPPLCLYMWVISDSGDFDIIFFVSCSFWKLFFHGNIFTDYEISLIFLPKKLKSKMKVPQMWVMRIVRFFFSFVPFIEQYYIFALDGRLSVSCDVKNASDPLIGFDVANELNSVLKMKTKEKKRIHFCSNVCNLIFFFSLQLLHSDNLNWKTESDIFDCLKIWLTTAKMKHQKPKTHATSRREKEREREREIERKWNIRLESALWRV